jgi:ubiquitin carboxyl-terminal hydrolase 7
MVKVNDKFVFSKTLHLDEFLTEDADRAVPQDYRLHSVLVHSGDVHGGHYYVYIADVDQQWLKFDDEIVTKQDDEAAVSGNFGGSVELNAHNKRPRHAQNCSSAYMLVYVREADLPSVRTTVEPDMVPQHLVDRFVEEQNEDERRRKERSEAHLYTDIRVVRDEDLKAFTQYTASQDFVDPEAGERFHVKKTMTLREFYDEVEAQLKIPVCKQRLWSCIGRENKTTRPDEPWSHHKLDETVESQNDTNSKQTLLYLQTNFDPSLEDVTEDVSKQGPSAALEPLPPNGILLFLKYFDPTQPQLEQQLQYIGCHAIDNTSQARALLPIMLEHLGKLTDEKLILYEEVKPCPDDVDEIDLAKVLREAELQHGDVICFQLDDQSRVPQYFEAVLDKIEVTFREIWTRTDVTVDLSKKTTYEQVSINGHMLALNSASLIMHLAGSAKASSRNWSGGSHEIGVELFKKF